MDIYKYVTFKQLRIIKLIFYGTPRAGKTTLRKQLLRLVEGQRLQPCDSIEPSTNIAEMCDPIFVQRIVMTNEESNEWKWSTQKLDDIAKALLLCLDNKLLQSETERSDSLDTAQHENTIETLQLNSKLKEQEGAKPQDFDESQEGTSDSMHHSEFVERNVISTAFV